MTRVFDIEPIFFERFDGMHIVVYVVDGVDSSHAGGALLEDWREAYSQAGQLNVANAQSHPRVKSFRESFKAAGVSMKKFPISIEAMLRRAMKGGDAFRINPVVDFYNTVSLRHVCPAGAFDLDAMDNQIDLRLTRVGDTFTALDSDDVISLEAGEMAYATGRDVITRHFMWRQSRLGLVDTNSTRLFFVAEVPGVAGLETADAILEDFRTGLKDHFGVAGVGAVLHSDSRRFEF